MKRGTVITAVNSRVKIKLQLTVESHKNELTRDETEREDNEIVDNLMEALMKKFYAKSITIIKPRK